MRISLLSSQHFFHFFVPLYNREYVTTRQGKGGTNNDRKEEQCELETWRKEEEGIVRALGKW